MHERIREKNKVRIITLYHANYNFGGLLQAYVLPMAIKKIFNIDAEQIDYIKKNNEIKKKYVVCYLLGDNENQGQAVKKFVQKIHLSILMFLHIFLNDVRKCDLFFGDTHDYILGLHEFLGLIRNAEFVITDSFHACVFSMIFEQTFVVFEHNKIGEKGNMNSRIYDFLEEYHLDSQLVTEKELEDMEEIPKSDFTYAHAHWKKRREESLKYLESALKDNQNGVEE